jgi:hypothetical protein
MGGSMTGPFEKTNVMDRDDSNGRMEPSTRVSSGTDNEKARVFTPFRMEVVTKDRGEMEGTADLEFVRGRMGDVTRVNGSMEWRTGRVSKPLRMERFDTMDCGLKMNPYSTTKKRM